MQKQKKMMIQQKKVFPMDGNLWMIQVKREKKYNTQKDRIHFR